jgi:CHAD domain-containing protein
MTCEMAFRTAATHYLDRLTAQHKGTVAGEAVALHAMRVILTRFRTTVALFSPMVDGGEQVRFAAELKWLNAHLGIVRDLDVALERLAKSKKQASITDQSLKKERAACQRHLTRALRSLRYRRLIKDLTAWIAHGDWSRKTGKQATERRTQPADEYCADRLTQWRKKLLKNSRKLMEFGARKRHKVRLSNKRLTYAIEAAQTWVPSSDAAERQATLKLLRKAQKSLGQLNDDARYRALSGALGNGKADGADLLLKPKQKKRLLQKAANAYDDIADIDSVKLNR